MRSILIQMGWPGWNVNSFFVMRVCDVCIVAVYCSIEPFICRTLSRFIAFHMPFTEFVIFVLFSPFASCNAVCRLRIFVIGFNSFIFSICFVSVSRSRFVHVFSWLSVCATYVCIYFFPFLALIEVVLCLNLSISPYFLLNAKPNWSENIFR